MVGRGALNIPNLSHVLKSNAEKMPWNEIQKILQKYANVENEYGSGFTMWHELNNGYVI